MIAAANGAVASTMRRANRSTPARPPENPAGSASGVGSIPTQSTLPTRVAPGCEAGEVLAGHDGDGLASGDDEGDGAGEGDGTGEGAGPHHAGRLFPSRPLKVVSGSIFTTERSPFAERWERGELEVDGRVESRRNASCVPSGDQVGPHDGHP